jgi:hypothetical protein
VNIPYALVCRHLLRTAHPNLGRSGQNFDHIADGGISKFNFLLPLSAIICSFPLVCAQRCPPLPIYAPLNGGCSQLPFCIPLPKSIYSSTRHRGFRTKTTLPPPNGGIESSICRILHTATSSPPSTGTSRTRVNDLKRIKYMHFSEIWPTYRSSEDSRLDGATMKYISTDVKVGKEQLTSTSAAFLHGRTQISICTFM